MIEIQSSMVFMCFAIMKGVSAVVGPLVAAALHPKKLGNALKMGRGGWGGYGYTGRLNTRQSQAVIDCSIFCRNYHLCRQCYGFDRRHECGLCCSETKGHAFSFGQNLKFSEPYHYIALGL